MVGCLRNVVRWTRLRRIHVRAVKMGVDGPRGEAGVSCRPFRAHAGGVSPQGSAFGFTLGYTPAAASRFEACFVQSHFRCGLPAVAVLLAAVVITAWLPRPARAQRLVLPGNPLQGITIEEFERFRLGLEDFIEVEDAAEGLGPAYNGTGCSACHNSPAIGGISPVSEVRAGRLDAEGNFEVLGGGTLFHIFSIPDHSCQPIIPPEANVVTKRVPSPLFGAGLVEAIADETLVALDDPNDLNDDGISGRAARIIDVGTGSERIGRFGWKSQHATLLAFGADAYRNEMGITNDLFLEEVAAGVDPEALAFCDLRPDPEDTREPATGLRGIDNFDAFMKFLAPIDRAPLTEEAAWGEGLFDSVGCSACHIPVLQTGRNSNPSLQ